MINLPIIRLEVEGMRHAMVAMLTEEALKLDEQVQEAVKAFCMPENIKRIVEAEVNRTLDQVIKEEVRNFFTYGQGREVVKAAVIQKLEKNITYTILDEL